MPANWQGLQALGLHRARVPTATHHRAARSRCEADFRKLPLIDPFAGSGGLPLELHNWSGEVRGEVLENCGDNTLTPKTPGNPGVSGGPPIWLTVPRPGFVGETTLRGWTGLYPHRPSGFLFSSMQMRGAAEATPCCDRHLRIPRGLIVLARVPAARFADPYRT